MTGFIGRERAPSARRGIPTHDHHPIRRPPHPLDKLVPSPANVRKTPPSAAEDAELKASIRARGLKHNLERAVLLQGLPRWRGVELHNVEIVGLHPDQTLFHPGDHVFSGEDVLPPLAARSRGSADQTAAFAGQVIFRAPVRDVAANPLLAQPVINPTCRCS